MFDAWVKENDLSNPAVKVTPEMLGGGQLRLLGLILAQEFGEADIASKLRTVSVANAGLVFSLGCYLTMMRLDARCSILWWNQSILATANLASFRSWVNFRYAVIVATSASFTESALFWLSGEEWPRGQSSALHICSEVMSPGAW